MYGIDSQVKEVVTNAVDDKVKGIAGGIAYRFISVLEIAVKANSRKEIFCKLNMANDANNFETSSWSSLCCNHCRRNRSH